jgi:hypothetical protein
MELDQAIIHLNLKMCQRSLASRRRLGPSRWDRVDKWYYDLVGVEKPLWISRVTCMQYPCSPHKMVNLYVECFTRLTRRYENVGEIKMPYLSTANLS